MHETVRLLFFYVCVSSYEDGLSTWIVDGTDSTVVSCRC